MSGILVTGADGYLGRRLTGILLRDTGAPLVLWMRAASDAEAAGKRERLAPFLAGAQGRVRLVFSDLAAEQPFADVDPDEVGVVVHSAAVTRFNVDEDTARRVNVEGTRKTIAFARRCPRLRSFALLSTVYASGLREGGVEEAPLDGDAGFANHYERSKWEAERLLLDRPGELPGRIFRVATVIADDTEGRVTQYNAVHNTLKLFYYGLLSLIPGRGDVPLYFVTGEFAASAVAKLLEAGSPGSIYNVAHRREESLTVDEFVEIAFAAFQESEDFRARRILKPLRTDAESFDLLVEAARDFGGEVVKQALASVSPFARQLFVMKEVDNRRLREGLGRYHAPDPRRLLQDTCAHLVRTRFGRTAVTESVRA